jgi:Predicted membrane protein (DUF2339)
MVFALAIVAILLALAYVRSQLYGLRSSVQRLEEEIDGRIRALEQRLGQLEATHAQAARAVRQTEASAASPAVQRTTQMPTPMAAVGSETTRSIPPESSTQDFAPMVAAVTTMGTTALPAVAPQQNTIAAATREQTPIRLSKAVAFGEVEPAGALQFASINTEEFKRSMPESPREQEQVLSLEERLGANWLNKLGIAILVIGLAFFLATRLKTMGPGGKVLTGLTASLMLLAGGLWLERKQTYRIFARAGIGGGWALLFFTAFAMHHFEATRVISSLTLDLLLMLLVAAGMVLHSLRYRSQTVTGLAFLLAFATVATSHVESASGTVVFGLLASAVLALGLVVVTTLRHWAWLELAGLIAVMANHFLWLALAMPAMSGGAGFPLFWQSTALILFYWATFRAAYLLRVPLDENEDRVSSLSAVVTSGGVLGLLKFQSAHPEWAFWALLALGTLEIFLGVWARAKRRSAFVVLTTIASVLLVAAVPYQFHGVSWPVLWLVEAHALALCGLRLGEPVFRRLGLLAGFAASLVLAFHDVAPLAGFRLMYPDAGHHPSLTIGLILAAALFWLHGEVYPRRWVNIDQGDLERLALAVTSWLGLGAAATALWVVLPAQWVVVGWLALVVLLGIAADWRNIVSVALQADVLATIVIPALFVWDFADAPQGMYKLPVGVAILLFYGGMRRKTVLENSIAYVAPAYSWVASLLLLGWVGQVVSGQWLVLAWAGLALALFEIGRLFGRSYLCWQGFVPALLTFLFLLGRWFDQPSLARRGHGWFAISGPDLLSVLAAAALAYWLQERTRGTSSSGRGGQIERWIGILAGVAGTFAVASWLPLLIPGLGVSESAPVAWAVLASLLLGVAVLTRRGAFQLHGIGVCLWTGVYGATSTLTFFHPHLPWWQSNLFRLGLASAILLAGLLFAFPLRRICASDERWAARPEFAKRPEQRFFFVPFALMIVTLGAELRSGNITLGWSLLGVAAFVFALLVGERSFRLGGLALLMLSVVKILFMDVWTLAPADRYTTLIVMGCALLLVSFLYTRFRDVFLKYL